MNKRPLGRSGLTIAPLVFGGNVFGWTADESTSFDLLDALVDSGIDGIDTADVYSRWVPGNEGGESERIIGRWLKQNPGKREKVVLMTKVGSDLGDGKKGLSAKWIGQAVEDSLQRLQTDVIDLYQSHWPDGETPYEETLGAYQELIKAGKVRAIGASNLDAAQLGEALAVAKEKKLPRYETLQPEYNLYDRAKFDGALADLAEREDIGVITYFSLASGFLSGKYRSKADAAGAKRAQAVEKYFDARGERILAALDRVASELGAKPAEVALAWVMARPGVTAPIASATSRDQLQSLVKATELTLSPEAMTVLNDASA